MHLHWRARRRARQAPARLRARMNVSEVPRMSSGVAFIAGGGGSGGTPGGEGVCDVPPAMDRSSSTSQRLESSVGPFETACEIGSADFFLRHWVSGASVSGYRPPAPRARLLGIAGSETAGSGYSLRLRPPRVPAPRPPPAGFLLRLRGFRGFRRAGSASFSSCRSGSSCRLCSSPPSPSALSEPSLIASVVSLSASSGAVVAPRPRGRRRPRLVIRFGEPLYGSWRSFSSRWRFLFASLITLLRAPSNLRVQTVRKTR